MGIVDIFYKGLETEKQTVIKSIPINWNEHKQGILNIARDIEPKFTIDKQNKDILTLMLLYFTGNSLFVEELKKHSGVDGSLNKGLLLLGGVGTGKTLLFEIFKLYTSQVLRSNSFQLFNALEIIDNVNISGVKELEKFNFFKDKAITCYLDDIAASNEHIKHYGTNLSVMEQLLSIRYTVFNRGILTHATTNKYPSELTGIYEMRIIDRLKQMFNFIEIKGDSRRR